MKKLIAIILVLIALPLLVSCRDKQIKHTTNQVVFFTYRDDASIPTLYGVETGSKIEEPADPIRIGFRFEGWYTDFSVKTEETKWDFDVDIVEKSMTLYANWSTGNYSITYNLEGGSFRPNDKIVYEFSGDKTVVFTNPSKVGYSFGGWYNKPIDEITPADKAITSTKDIFYDLELYANWIPVRYNVTFRINNDGVTGLPNPPILRVDYGTPINFPIPENTATHRFIGWFDANDLEYINGQAFTTTYNTVVFAKWVLI